LKVNNIQAPLNALDVQEQEDQQYHELSNANASKKGSG
jgi:hypothetical protein